MNERIKQLLDQAQELAREEVKSTPEFAKYAPSYAIPGTEIHVGIRLSYEKFAELIVKECVDKITTYDLVPGHSAKWEDIYDIHTRLLQDLGEELKKHFGVEQ